MPDTTVPRAIVLYGRASFDRTPSLDSLVERVTSFFAAQGEPARVAAAHADLAGPSLPAVLAALEGDGVREATVVPCMIPADPTLSTWLPGALSHWSGGRDRGMLVRLAPPVERALDLAAAVIALARAEAAVLDDVRSVPPSLGKPGWSEVPEHARQLFFCTGARCLHRGADALYQHLRAAMKPHRALNAGPGRVMCARTSCLYPCNRGPLMVVHPDALWYGDLTPERISRVVDALVEGAPPRAEAFHAGMAPLREEAAMD